MCHKGERKSEIFGWICRHKKGTNMKRIIATEEYEKRIHNEVCEIKATYYVSMRSDINDCSFCFI